jgi:hypothetical protein
MAESKTVDQASNVQADEKHVAKAEPGTVDPNAGKAKRAVSELRAEQAQVDYFGDKQLDRRRAAGRECQDQARIARKGWRGNRFHWCPDPRGRLWRPRRRYLTLIRRLNH